jgi:hypothetical protein
MRVLKTFAVAMLLGSSGFSGAGLAQTYSTRFAGSEDPLSEDGRWANNGVDWTRIKKANGIAYGTQTGTNTGIYKFDDSYAHLSGFPPDQEAWGEAYISKPSPGRIQELEILLRWTSSAHRTTGYECFARCISNDSSYLQIVRWDGPLGKFTYLADKRGTNYGLNKGDTLKASVIGNTITVYINGIEKAQVKDDTYKTGNPGIGVFRFREHQGEGSNSDFGFSSFTAHGIGKIECFGASDLDRVFDDGYGGAPRQNTISLFGLRNETVSGQCVIVAHEDLQQVTFSLGPLQHTQSTNVIPASNVTWNFVDNIFVEKNSPNREKSGLLRPAPAWFPDYLSEERNCAIGKNAQKAVYRP